MASVSILFAALACYASTAQAARIHQLLLSEPLPEQRDPFALAVNQGTHHFYVLLSGNGGPNRPILNYEANGQIDPLRPELIGAPAPHLYVGVAVDNSSGPFAGYVYATNSSNQTIQQFDANGEATAVTIGEAAIPANGTPQGGGLPPVVNPGGFQPRRIAVDDSSGDLFVTDDSARAIDQFTPAGTFVAQLVAGSVSETRELAPDGSGHLYLANESALAGSIFRTAASPEGAGLFELDIATGACVQAACAPIASAPVIGLAFDKSRETIFTTATGGTEEGRLSEYSAASGQLLGVTSSARLHIPEVGIDESTGEVIVGDLRHNHESTIQIYGPAEVVPDVKALAAEGVGLEAATLKGEIGAAGVAGATCVFQYVDSEEFAAHRFEGASEAECEHEGAPSGPFSGEAMNPVEASIEGLRGGTTYEYHLVGKNGNGSNASESSEFTTHGPTISGTAAGGIGETAATLEGFVDPRSLSTTYIVQYVTQASFEVSGFSGATEVPAGGAVIGAGITPVAVSQRVEGLTPSTAYRFRIVATSGEGETRGQDVFFATFGLPTPVLPDGRRYEQVSPIDKNGGNVQGSINSVQASLEGSAVTFFTNTGIPGGEGSQEFPTYLSSRAPDASGWSTQGLLPPGSYGPRAHVLGWTEDLLDVYDFATPAFEAGKLLRRSSAGGGLTQVGTTKAVRSTFSFSGSSTNGQEVLLESEDGGLLPNDLLGKQNLYAYDRATGALVLAGVLNPTAPGGEPVVPPAGAMAGSFGWWGSEGVTFGGSRGTYFTQAQHAISADGQRIVFTAEETGQLFMRVNPFMPQSAMSGGHCNEAKTKACTIPISAPEEGVVDPGTPAAFVGASANGSVVYFLDRGKLTAGATGGSGYDLYRYEVATGDLSDLTLDSTDKRGARVEGLLGMSTDGNTVYIVAVGKLAEGTSEAAPGETNLYALEGGAIRFITRLGTKETGDALNWIPVARTVGSVLVAHTSRVSSDGRTLLFRSDRQLTSYQNHGVPELYLDRLAAGITCISCNPTGQAPDGPAGVQEIPPVGIKLGRSYSFMTRNLSADGRRVIFDSADRLVAADENNVNDVYEWEVPGTGTCTEASDAYSPQDGGCLYLISGGANGVGGSYFGDADPKGENIFFFTAQPLVSQDQDELVDVYDARVGGGIAAQEEELAPPCGAAESCHGAASSPPALPSPGSSSFVGPGSPKQVAPCRKGRVKRHGKCVPRHKKHGHKKHGHKKHGHKGRQAGTKERK
jgi:hypothetical protein